MAKNLSRENRNALRREKSKTFDIKDWRRSQAQRQAVLERKGGDDATRKLKERYFEEEKIQKQASKLFEQYSDVGVTWAACVQAVKTDWVPSFHNVWGSKLKAVKGNDDRRARDYSAED